MTHTLRTILALFLLCGAVGATTLTGTLVLPAGASSTGTLRLTPPTATNLSRCDFTRVSTAVITIAVRSGVVNGSVVGNDCLSGTSNFYTVAYTDSNAAVYNATWIITGSTFDVSTQLFSGTYTGASGAVTSVAGATGVTLPDFTYVSNTLVGSSTGGVDLSATGTAGTGLRLPVGSALPTVDGQISVRSNTHTLVFGSNGSTKTAVDTGVTSLSNLSSIGTVSTGVWQSTPVGPQWGGTGQDTSASTGIPYISGGTWSVLTTTGSGSSVLAGTPTLSAPILGAATGTSLALGGATIGSDALAVTGTTTHNSALTLNSAPLILQGNISAAAWTTFGLRIKGVPGTLTDTTSTGTVATAYTDVLGGNTIAASAATVFTNYFTQYVKDPVQGTNVTLTNKWSIGADSIFGTTIKGGAYQSSDGSPGVTVTTCTAFKNGLCVAGT